MSPPAKNRSLAGRSSITIGSPGIGRPSASVGWASRGKPSASPTEARVAKTIAARAGQLPEPGALQVGLQEADLAAERAGRRAASPLRNAPRVGSSTSSRVSRRDRAGEGRQPDLRETAGRSVDCSSSLEPLVEGPGRAERVAAADADRRREAAEQLGVDALAREVEAGADALLDRAGERSGRAFQKTPRLAVGADDAVFAEADAACRPGSGSSGASSGRRLTRVNRSTERFLPPRLRRPMSKKPRGANSSRSRAPPPAAPARSTCLGLEAAAVADRRRRRLLDRHQHVAPRRRPMLELTDVDRAGTARARSAARRLSSMSSGRAARRASAALRGG